MAVSRNIIHLEKDGKHEYFGSPASLYDVYSAEDLGISQAALNNHFYKLNEDDEQIYRNKKCIIRKGVLHVKSMTRGRKKESHPLP